MNLRITKNGVARSVHKRKLYDPYKEINFHIRKFISPKRKINPFSGHATCQRRVVRVKRKGGPGGGVASGVEDEPVAAVRAKCRRQTQRRGGEAATTGIDTTRWLNCTVLVWRKRTTTPGWVSSRSPSHKCSVGSNADEDAGATLAFRKKAQKAVRAAAQKARSEWSWMSVA